VIFYWCERENYKRVLGDLESVIVGGSLIIKKHENENY